MEDKIRYAIIEEGSFKINTGSQEEILDYPQDWYMRWSCIDDDRNLYIIYDDDNFYENDSKDFQYIVKLDGIIDEDNNKFPHIIDLTDNDIDYINKNHGLLFGLYSQWGSYILPYLIKMNMIDMRKWDDTIELDYSERDNIVKKNLYNILKGSLEIFGKNE